MRLARGAAAAVAGVGAAGTVGVVVAAAAAQLVTLATRAATHLVSRAVAAAAVGATARVQPGSSAVSAVALRVISPLPHRAVERQPVSPEPTGLAPPSVSEAMAAGEVGGTLALGWAAGAETVVRTAGAEVAAARVDRPALAAWAATAPPASSSSSHGEEDPVDVVSDTLAGTQPELEDPPPVIELNAPLPSSLTEVSGTDLLGHVIRVEIIVYTTD